eukprot:340545_1
MQKMSTSNVHYHVYFILLLLTDNIIHCNTHQGQDGLSFFGEELSLKRSLLNIPIISDASHRAQRKLLRENQSNIEYPVRLTVSPSILTTPNGFETIRVSWSGATMGSYEDWIGIYSPPNSSDIDYLDFFDTYGADHGTHEVLVWNMRDDYQLRYFTSDAYKSYYELQGTATARISPNQPLQGHLSLTTHSPNEMQIRWISSLVSNPMVQIGTTSKQYTHSFTATHSTYNTSQMCGSSASIVSAKQFRHPGYIYTAIMTGLQPNTRYFYRFGNTEYWSNESDFMTSSSQGSTPKPFGFIMYGDQGTTTASFQHIEAVQKEIDNDRDMMKLVLHIGDLSYAWGNGYNWDKWGNMISSVATSVPYMISIGNHEYCHLSPPNDGGPDVSGAPGDGYHPSWGNFHDDSSGECGVPSYHRFDAEIGENSNSIFWYSFNYESVHFIVLSSEHNYSKNTRGYNFLMNDLKDINHTVTPWTIVNIHRPLYQSEIYNDDNIVDDHLLQLLEPMFYEYDVDVVLAGHFHSYERTCEVYNYSCIGRDNGGIVHLTMGAAGWELDNAKYSVDPYVVFRNEIDFGYGKFLVNDTHLFVQYITTPNQEVIDEVVLARKDKMSNGDEPLSTSETSVQTQPISTETERMECVPSTRCICILHEAVCCDGMDYASECDANCQCASRCKMGQCGLEVRYSIIGGSVALFVCVVLFCFMMSKKCNSTEKQIKYQLALMDLDNFGNIDEDTDMDMYDEDMVENELDAPSTENLLKQSLCESNDMKLITTT